MGYVYYTSNPAGMQSKAPHQPKTAEFLKVWFTYNGQSCTVLLKINIKVKAASPKKAKFLYGFASQYLTKAILFATIIKYKGEDAHLVASSPFFIS